jgi:branched-chain amino acid transport system ATP-binding protein
MTDVSSPILETEGVTVRFGGNVALNEVDVEATPGLITGLIGPNGAGKTTLFNVITGLLPPTSGRVIFEGKDVSLLPTHRRARRGIGRTFQRLELFTTLSVRDNIRVAGEIRNTWNPLGRFTGQHMSAAREADRVIDLIGLADVAELEVSAIPTGTARRVELGRALMTRPKLLLLDEPASGQTEEETRVFGNLLKQLAHEEGYAILLVEHDMDLVMTVCDHIHVLDFGNIIASGLPDDIRRSQAVLDAYLGSAEESG